MIPGLDIILGGVTGLVGNAFTTWFKYKNAKLQYDHEQRMVGLQTSAMVQEYQMKIQINKAIVEGEIEVADSEVFKTSQEVGTKKLFSEKWIDMIMKAGEGKWYKWIFTTIGSLVAFLFAIVDWINGMMRPALTVYLLGGSTFITYSAWMIMQANQWEITADQAVAIYNQVTQTMIYLTVSAVTWWFGDRTMSKYLQQMGAKDDKLMKNAKGPKGQGGGDVDI
jgi:hypothetical protein